MREMSKDYMLNLFLNKKWPNILADYDAWTVFFAWSIPDPLVFYTATVSSTKHGLENPRFRMEEHV